MLTVTENHTKQCGFRVIRRWKEREKVILEGWILLWFRYTIQAEEEHPIVTSLKNSKVLNVIHYFENYY